MDRRKQELGRSSDPGDIEQQALLLREKIRSHEVDKNKIEFAAFLGDDLAKLAISEYEKSFNGFEPDVDGEGANELFGYIEEHFGKPAIASLFASAFRSFRRMYEGFVSEHGLSHSDCYARALHFLDQTSQGHTVSDDLLQDLFLELDEEASRLSDRSLEEFEDGYPDEASYALRLILALKRMIANIHENFQPVSYRTDSATVYKDLTDTFLESIGSPSNRMLRGMSSELRESILRLASGNVEDQEEEFVDPLLLTLMKKGGLEWALKDVK